VLAFTRANSFAIARRYGIISCWGYNSMRNAYKILIKPKEKSTYNTPCSNSEVDIDKK